MMESLPKIADLKLLQELSKVLVVPMLIAAVIVQTGLSIDLDLFEIEVSKENSMLKNGIMFFFVFLIKGSLTALTAILVHEALLYLHFVTHFFALHALSTLFLSFGLIGLFAGEEMLFLNSLNKMWFYTSFVYGFYFLAKIADIDHVT